ncbi:MAG: response regulator [Fuerstiella sp.]
MAENSDIQGLHIIVLDDEPLVLSSISMLLDLMGHSVVQTTHGQEVLDAIAEGQRFDVAILDLTIRRGPDGQEIASQVRASSPDTKLVLTTGYGSNPVVDDYQDYGFDDKLLKPFNMDDLTALLQRLTSSD